jgi:arabinosaccharide transport system permease protein
MDRFNARPLATPSATMTTRRRRAVSLPVVSRAVLLYAVLGLVLITTALPYLWMISGSFKTNSEIVGRPLAVIPQAPTVRNYVDLLDESQIPYLHQLANSGIIAVSVVVLSLAVSSLTGYGFAKFEFRFKRPLFLIVLATLMVPAQITLVPLFLLMHAFGWLDHLQAVIVPAAFNAFGVFFMRQTMLAVPTELLEAARSDGASELRLYWQIALPLARGGLTVLGILAFLGAWNDFLWPLIVLSSDTNMTVAVGIANLVGLYKVHFGMINADAFLSTLPIVAAFVILRNHFVSGLTAGAFKGA